MKYHSHNIDRCALFIAHSCASIYFAHRLKNYFHTLGLPSNATLDQVKQAYRTLVKQYHPDLNKSPGSAERFIEIHEAYEFLIDERRRLLHAESARRQAQNREEQERRDRIYQVWVQYQQDLARQRAQQFARNSFSEFEKSKYYGVVKKANFLTNVLTLITCCAIIGIPIWKYIAQQDLPEHQQKSFMLFFIPSLAGLICLAWGYYYWFILKVDEFK